MSQGFFARTTNTGNNASGVVDIARNMGSMLHKH